MMEMPKEWNWEKIGADAARLFDMIVLSVFEVKRQRSEDENASAPVALSTNIAIRALIEFFESNSETNPCRDVEHAAAVALAKFAEKSIDDSKNVRILGGKIVKDAALAACADLD